ncbi:MAG TPA: Ran-binding zinc finger domain-containing protein [Gemmatimonadaceae bacterium]|nr:Ran-binding zinc finger domain-containing protein [Gemmatimonadaceae bacterium]
MTNSLSTSMDALSALLEERRRYETWIAQLDARRTETPGHVFDKVRADYDHRLRGVTDQLRARAAEVESSCENLAERVNALQAEENARRDERAEAEIRSAVGEYHPEHAREMLARCDEEIGRIASERTTLAGELTRMQEILMLARRPVESAPAPRAAAPTPAPQAAPAAPPAAADGAAGFDELKFLESVVRPEGSPLATQPAGSAPPPPPQAQAMANVADFLSPAHRTAPSAEPLQSRGAPARGASTTPARSTPPFLKDMPTEQVKTLKCQECGTMNYPTEWYCERCGGELAAM